ncbi:hypothetical protein NDU88_007660 [Pleurodeles waltl]|uniref:Uncharacterized protein n=1 Tax=Pleurodeles waltl TaxID=8319 RepID=A0AAV7QLB1_PLEWA|nr:hypothetical protein NDU88_007660 [Pleurodeles waltl]
MVAGERQFLELGTLPKFSLNVAEVPSKGVTSSYDWSALAQPLGLTTAGTLLSWPSASKPGSELCSFNATGKQHQSPEWIPSGSYYSACVGVVFCGVAEYRS